MFTEKDPQKFYSKHYNYYVKLGHLNCVNIYSLDGWLASVGCEHFTGMLTQEIAEIVVKAFVDGVIRGSVPEVEVDISRNK